MLNSVAAEVSAPLTELKTLYIKTFGCQMNEYDSNRMIDLLKITHGLTLVDTPELADVLILNTCSIREKAEEKVFSELGRLYAFKKKRPHVVIGVGGCVGSQEGAVIQKRAPYVDVVFGPQTLHRLPNLINQATRTRSRVVDISFPTIEKFDELPAPTATGSAAYVSIMEGCSKYCTYCVVPYTRGEEVSRPFDDVLHEVFGLAQQGVRDVTLLGQNVNAYRGKKHDGGIADLALLIRYVAEIEGIAQIRFMTSHPVEFSENLIEAYRTVPQLVDHLHLPVQSGSDRILRLMKRGHTAAEYIRKIEQLRAVRPNITISSDFIVGFPGETEEDFEATLSLVKTLQFDQSFSFIYSPRPGTPASKVCDDVPLAVKKQRLQRLQDQLNAQALAWSQKMLGSLQPVIIQGLAKKDEQYWMGRTVSGRVINFPKSKNTAVGDCVTVRVLAITGKTLRGEIV
jgi:tRNA-2-methylthio-N6-dimethylallyladenosine synthase